MLSKSPVIPSMRTKQGINPDIRTTVNGVKDTMGAVIKKCDSEMIKKKPHEGEVVENLNKSGPSAG